MRERPILFQGAMVRAILAGTKSQTRRVVKPHRSDDAFVLVDEGAGWVPYRSDDGESQSVRGEWVEERIPCPYGQPGDRLWVRESWMDVSRTGIEARDPHTLKPTRYAYMADTPAGSYADQCRKDYGLKWRPSIHMPRWACRLVLEITAVRVERLQDISEADAIAEGVTGLYAHARANPQGAYRALWESINAPGSWDANPWVWVLEFRRAAMSTTDKEKQG